MPVSCSGVADEGESILKAADPNTIEFSIGGIVEFNCWWIKRDEHHSDDFPYFTPCSHAVRIGPDHPAFEVDRNHPQYIIPRVVEAANEGGFCSTTVCLDCILEAARRLDAGEVAFGQKV